MPNEKKYTRYFPVSDWTERLETRTALSGAAIVQPFSDVVYFGSDDDWSLNNVNAPEVWSKGYTGQDIVVAVIDTGVDLQHLDLVDSIWTNADEIPGNNLDDDGNGYVDDIQGWDFVSNDAIPQDPAGHGTHIAGTIVAANNGIGATGIAFDATIMPIRVLGEDGTGSQIDMGAGIRYAVANGADIINLSLGGLGSRRVSRAIKYAQEHDVFIVAASGNNGANQPDYPARYSATFDNVLSVGAFNAEYELANFTNSSGTSGAVQVDAPGVGVFSTGLNNTFRFSSGTSVAAPLVSGMAALALSADDSLSPNELRSIIVQGANQAIKGSDSMGGVNAAYTVALAAQNFTQPTLPSDIDGDGTVNFTDFLILSQNFGSEVAVGTAGDIDGDGYVQFADFLIFSQDYGISLEPRPAAAPLDHFFADERALSAAVEESWMGRLI